MTKFETKAHKVEKVNGYVLKVYESDPYYHVKVSKDGEHVDDHLLMNDAAEFDALKRKYERMIIV
jgi:hypothetical protein